MIINVFRRSRLLPFASFSSLATSRRTLLSSHLLKSSVAVAPQKPHALSSNRFFFTRQSRNDMASATTFYDFKPLDSTFYCFDLADHAYEIHGLMRQRRERPAL